MWLSVRKKSKRCAVKRKGDQRMKMRVCESQMVLLDNPQGKWGEAEKLEKARKAKQQ